MKRIGKQRMMATVTRETGGDRKFTSLSHPRSPSRGLADWVVLAVLALGMTHTPAAHATLMVNFDVFFNGDARLTGIFEAQDINNDTIINEDEVSTITATYHPGHFDIFYPQPVTLAHPPDSLFRLMFDLATEILYNIDLEDEPAYINYIKQDVYPIVVSDESGEYNAINRYEELAQNNEVTRVPEPTTLALLSLGFAGLGFAQRKMKS
jgi:hypothetical protein